MAWLEAAIVGGKAVAATGSLITASPWALRIVKRGYWRATRGRVIIPVFGAGGTGKTTVAKILTGAPIMDVAGLYRESLRIEDSELKGDIPGVVKVAPGQIARIDRYWPKLFRDISNNKSSGLINVVSYGHHSMEINSFKEHDLYNSRASMNDFRKNYLEYRRKIEVDFLKHVSAGLYLKEGKFWFLTVVNKQDLWSRDGVAVRDFYENGNYRDVLESIEKKIGKNNFQHEFLAGSLCVSNLSDASGAPFIKTQAGFDINIQSASSSLMVEKIHRFIAQ